MSGMPSGTPVIPPGRPPAGLSIDEEGRFLVHGEPVTHARTLEVLWSGLGPSPDGGWQVRVGREAAPVKVAGTPYVVVTVALAADRSGATLLLAGGSREPLAPQGLRVGRDGVLRATLASGHTARFSRAAHVALGMALAEDPSAPGGYRLSLGGREWPVGAE
ncbi:MAG TPA: hypothetical protein VFM53_10890 [Anaeromyxobacteraceae bacterium]|nr:hypothetical protein [Anaeromyxobacteraceae bacterium]